MIDPGESPIGWAPLTIFLLRVYFIILFLSSICINRLGAAGMLTLLSLDCEHYIRRAASEEVFN